MKSIWVLTFVLFSITGLFSKKTYAIKPSLTWQMQLSGVIDTSVKADVYDIDLFDAKRETIDLLHSKGIQVICYFSAGSVEDWRPDAKLFPASVSGKDYECLTVYLLEFGLALVRQNSNGSFEYI